MSIASMTEVAFQSRTDVGSSTYVPRTLTQIAGAAAGRQESDTDVNTAIRTISTYIPTEVLTLYVAVLAALGASERPRGAYGPLWVAFFAFLGATPAVVLVVYLTKVKTAGKPISWGPRAWPLWEMVAGTLAFLAWALALPGSPFQEYADSWYSPGISGIAVLVTSAVLGLLAPLFARPLK